VEARGERGGERGRVVERREKRERGERGYREGIERRDEREKRGETSERTEGRGGGREERKERRVSLPSEMVGSRLRAVVVAAVLMLELAVPLGRAGGCFTNTHSSNVVSRTRRVECRLYERLP